MLILLCEYRLPCMSPLHQSNCPLFLLAVPTLLWDDCSRHSSPPPISALVFFRRICFFSQVILSPGFDFQHSLCLVSSCVQTTSVSLSSPPCDVIYLQYGASWLLEGRSLNREMPWVRILPSPNDLAQYLQRCKYWARSFTTQRLSLSGCF